MLWAPINSFIVMNTSSIAEYLRLRLMFFSARPLGAHLLQMSDLRSKCENIDLHSRAGIEVVPDATFVEKMEMETLLKSTIAGLSETSASAPLRCYTEVPCLFWTRDISNYDFWLMSPTVPKFSLTW